MLIRGLLFDKDGTLFRYSETWDTWCKVILEKLSNGDATLLQRLADSIEFDLKSQKIKSKSVVIAGTTHEVAEHLVSALPHWSIGALETFLNEQVNDLPLAEVTPLRAYLATLRLRGLKIGVMTNDSETNALAQLTRGGLNPKKDFDFVAGYDSGFGAKPAPEPLLAFAKAVDLPASEVAMVGDSLHDLMAGRHAGMKTIGVLTGPARKEDLSYLADVVLPDISHIPTYLDSLIR